jgi:hypothetical protein
MTLGLTKFAVSFAAKIVLKEAEELLGLFLRQKKI